MSIRAVAEAARASLPALARSSGTARSAFLERMAQNIRRSAKALIAENAEDVSASLSAGRTDAFLDRLALDQNRVDSLVRSLLQMASLPDPLYGVEETERLDSGLTVGRMRVPLGLIAFVCEARPGAAAEAAALAVKSGNAMVCKPGKESARSSRFLGAIMKRSLREAGLPEEAVAVLPSMDREEVLELVRLDGVVDLVIPRGGEGLIRLVAENSRVPVLKHYRGVCHLYVDRGADVPSSVRVIIDAKTSRPATCNALECLLVHEEAAPELAEALIPELRNNGVAVRASRSLMDLMRPLGEDLLSEAAPGDFDREYLDLVLNMASVPDLDAALDHIRLHGSNHTESIMTPHLAHAVRFTREADASCVMVNASTRLNDGGVLGLGGEIGISTSKLHAYGPMGLKELTARKFVVMGDGHVRG
ncbi:MAG: glutamate-5-semialdehyde dehydrogenase [Deltaproteobacteria bacterium]|jgi:glutamate-5-semialdehyde dehydrogenase|nr:glutamate-5-semialdehyde dehydrogenase [Deltaproteobacteria bacterium]